ncbi:hypothetical protein BDW02DRAFT_570455 [Decorospora gaudefroyi]|uniref:Uncharacterized protein n=1 Tax=Decorospora gaudefroyi TaxID=184978 RepID=A0A6A5KAQ1_9PLEO|nr:hypothetical protein BDW02DRAFT_570455 [Decorospora gaudefroyi]
MAGARPLRISDTDTETSTRSQQGSVSQTAAVTDENADISARLSGNEIAATADEGSPNPGSPINPSTKAFCRNCNRHVGDFYNAWHRVTCSYYVPALLGSYSTTLKLVGKQKEASKGTDLEGCTIQPFSCLNPGCTDKPIGFTVVDAPAGKRYFRGRDFFKLGRLELQCEVAPNKTIVVEPREKIAPDLVNAEDSLSPSPESTRTPKASSAHAMDIDSRPSIPQPPEYAQDRHGQRNNHDQQQPVQPFEPHMQSLPPPSTSTHSASIPTPLQNIAQKAPSDPIRSPSLAQKPTYNAQHGTYMPPQETTVRPMGDRQRLASVPSQAQSPHESIHLNGHTYPRSPREISLDAIERLQTQISQNSGALAAHTRDIRRGEESFVRLEETLRREFQTQIILQSAEIKRVEEVATRLHHEVNSLRHTIEAINRELYASRVDKNPRVSTAPGVQPHNVQDSALELMAQQIATISQRTNEVDTLKLTIEIMKNKIYRLEEGAAPVSSQSPSHTHQASRDTIVPSSQSTHTAAAASQHSTPAMPYSSIAPQPSSNVQSHRPSLGTPSSTPMPDNTQRTESAPSQSSGWATINAGVKRNHQDGAGSPLGTTVHVPGSPKRQKLANMESHTGGTGPQGYSSGHQSQVENGMMDIRFQTPAHSLPSQHSIPESSFASQSQHPAYVPYSTQDGPSDDSWRPESQRNIEHRPRGRGRGGGSGTRGGRGRKSMPAQLHGPLGTPEWEREDWQGIPNSQTSPDGYYNHIGRSGRGGIARRGSGGGGTRGGHAPSERATSLGLQGVSGGMSFGSPGDLYGSAKRTRTKPIRNADGVLIRKDGRPDMRSQSSAANLRKVHARKDGEASHSPTAFTPTNLQYATSADNNPDSPSPSTYAADPAASEKHNAIMGKMFPTGIDASRKQHDYSRQVFEEDRDHTMHPCSQNHTNPAARSAIHVKKEQVDRNRMAELQSPPQQESGERESRHTADDEGRTGGGVHRESQAQDADPARPHEESSTQTVPETQRLESSETV